jgi:hypothetical protein
LTASKTKENQEEVKQTKSTVSKKRTFSDMMKSAEVKTVPDKKSTLVGKRRKLH